MIMKREGPKSGEGLSFLRKTRRYAGEEGKLIVRGKDNDLAARWGRAIMRVEEADSRYV